MRRREFLVATGALLVHVTDPVVVIWKSRACGPTTVDPELVAWAIGYL